MKTRRPSPHKTCRRRSSVLRLELLEDRTVPSFLGFSTPFTYPVGGTPISVAVGDLDSNGITDVVTANRDNNSVSVLLGNGDGTLRTVGSFSVTGGPDSVALGDFNGDGKLDVTVANQFNNTVSVLLGNGDGTLQAALSFAVGSSPAAVAVGDFNGDGKWDLAAANFTNNTVSVLAGNGDGTFQAAQNYTVGRDPVSVAVGDFNGDGALDLAVANAGSDSISLLLGNGSGAFGTAKNYSVGFYPNSVTTADLNGDGKLDLAVSNLSSDSVSVLLGNGDGSFQAAHSFADAIAGPISVAVADFNSDGIPDLAVASTGGGYGTGGVSVWFGVGNGSFAPAQSFPAGLSPFSVAAGEFISGDSKPDLAVASGNLNSNSVSLLLNEVPLSASAANFTATAGAPFNADVATFANAFPAATPASYTATIDWGDGSSSTGVITANGTTLTVSASHTYADPGSYALTVSIGGAGGATVYPTATVTSLGQTVQKGLEAGIGLWHNKNGQALINSFNGGPNSTALSSWLATNFANLYGASAGANDLTGFTNAQVAAFYQSQFALPGSNLEAQVLATALNIYATTLSLGGTVGQTYGFTVSADGLGAYSYNVGADGAAFGVANNTVLDVYALLQGVNDQTVFGVLYNGTTSLRKQAGDLFAALMQAGSIS
jgi:hypothetical protein